MPKTAQNLPKHNGLVTIAAIYCYRQIMGQNKVRTLFPLILWVLIVDFALYYVLCIVQRAAYTKPNPNPSPKTTDVTPTQAMINDQWCFRAQRAHPFRFLLFSISKLWAIVCSLFDTVSIFYIKDIPIVWENNVVMIVTKPTTELYLSVLQSAVNARKSYLKFDKLQLKVFVDQPWRLMIILVLLGGVCC
jgi:hypothetical protein